MEAVILAGGLGTRLRPLTYTRPKPLLPILNKPMIQRFLETIPKEVDKVIIPLNYLRNMVEDFLKSIDSGKEIICIEEKEPLGTGGAVKNVENYLSDTFLVLNVDVISSIDISDFIKFHRANKGIATISAWPVEFPEEFGVMELDKDKRILRFQEKPKREEAFSNLINAGAYALELEILDYIPSNKFVSMEREIFPIVLDKRMYGYEFGGYWLDTGRPIDYINAHKILLEKIDKEVGINTKLGRRASLENHILIGNNCEVDGAIQEYSCLGNNVTVSKGSTINSSVLMANVKIGKNSVIKRSILGEGCKVGNKVTLVDTVLGDGCVINDNIRLLNAKLDPNEEM
ncbi:MAG: NDP-sugar synthase [Candidatus Thermoplasmatota archaeon]|nr:NDP-sugar synthase [Candidatus Thermoplasmatota archaeon]